MGERQFGPYRLVRQIAVGGMAEIHLARARGIAGFEKYVALKMIHPNFSQDEQFIQMLIDEAKISVQLQHANVAQTFDLGRVDQTYYITMEYVDGADLYKLLRRASERNIQMPVDVAAYLTKEMASGLDYAHRKRDVSGDALGIVHRDVSPQNVLISHSGEVKLVDFGIAKATMKARQTAVGVIKGKYYYMSPEQAWGDRVDHRTDIFSAGIVLYEALVGQMLYLEEDLHRLLELVRKANNAPPTALRRDIPPQLERIVMHALEKNREDRYESAGDMASDLERFLHVYSPVFTAAKVADFFHKVLGHESLLAKVEADKQNQSVAAKREVGALDTLVRDRSELSDENSVIFRMSDLRRPDGSGGADAPSEPSEPSEPSGNAFIDSSTLALSEADLLADADERTVIDSSPAFDKPLAEGVRASEFEPTLVGETWDDADVPYGAGGGSDSVVVDEEGPTLTQTPEQMLERRASPAASDAPRPSRAANPVLAAATPKPAVSALRPPRQSRKTPAGGVSAHSGGSLLSDIVSRGMASEPVPVGGPPPAAQARPQGPSPPPSGIGPPGMQQPGMPGMQQPGMPGMQQPGMQQGGMQQPGMPGMQQPGMQQPGMQGMPGMQQPGMQQPGMYPGMPQNMQGFPGGPMVGGPMPGRPQSSGNFPLQAPMPTPPPGFNPIPGGPPPTFTRQLHAAMELDAIPDAYRIRRRPRWLIWAILGAVCVVLGVTLGFLLFRDDEVTPPGVLVLDSSPSGARVVVDGRELPDPTPTRLDDVPPGASLEIEFALPGYQSRVQEATIPDTGGESKVFAFLKREPVTLQVTSTPSRAEVWIDGAKVGETPVQLSNLNPDTTKEVEIRRTGFKSRKVPLDWTGKTELSVTVTLQK